MAELQAELARLKEEEASLDDIMGELEDEDEVGFDLGPRSVDAMPDFMLSEDDSTAVAGNAEAAAAAVPPPANDVPRGGTVAVAGWSTAVGKSLLRVMLAADNGWSLRALLDEGESIGQMASLGIQGAPSSSVEEVRAALEGASALVIVSAAAGGKGGIETERVKSLVAALPDSLRRVVFLSSHGVERTDQLPFSLANAWGGPLDKLRAAEQEVILRAKGRLPAFSIVRVGKLVDTDGAPRAALAPGDALQGDVSLSAASSVLVQSLERMEAVNASFSVGPLGPLDADLVVGPAGKGAPLEAAAVEKALWTDQFLKLLGPELYRRRLGGGAASLGATELRAWLRELALRFVRPGSGLTTPVELDDLDDLDGGGGGGGGGGGVILRFVQANPSAGYAAFDKEETNDEKWAKAKASTKASKATPDGALYLHAEVEPYARVRVTRAEMDGEGTLIKPMSEATILQALDKAIAELEKRRH